ncbi:HK97-gp10 family putative phage morphogenesis protein [Staphylococcus gallinarum]|uniref:HK97-gp10 family putative phage morphogenesis protein n=1 Tax=Staphylococcus gallinarum TaxID=1293 RepID=UPI0030BD2E2D
MDVRGIEALINKLSDMEHDIDDDIDFIIKKRSEQFSADTVTSAKSVMVKGYWTGNLARMVEAVKTGKLEYTIKSNAHYSGFLEYGTRYMAPETFMKPVYEKIAPQIAKDISRLLE